VGNSAYLHLSRPAARDAETLAAFYVNVFKCEHLREPKVLSGEKVSRGNGLPNSEIYSIWLKFPDFDAHSWRYMSTKSRMIVSSQR
jgi:hypothetical protein